MLYLAGRLSHVEYIALFDDSLHASFIIERITFVATREICLGCITKTRKQVTSFLGNGSRLRFGLKMYEHATVDVLVGEFYLSKLRNITKAIKFRAA